MCMDFRPLSGLIGLKLYWMVCLLAKNFRPLSGLIGLKLYIYTKSLICIRQARNLFLIYLIISRIMLKN